MKDPRNLSNLASQGAAMEHGRDLARSSLTDDAHFTPPAVLESGADYSTKRATLTWENRPGAGDLVGTARVSDCSFSKSGMACRGIEQEFPF